MRNASPVTISDNVVEMGIVTPTRNAATVRRRSSLPTVGGALSSRLMPLLWNIQTGELIAREFEDALFIDIQPTPYHRNRPTPADDRDDAWRNSCYSSTNAMRY